MKMEMDLEKLAAATKAKKASLKPKEKTLKPQPGANRYVLLPGWRKNEAHSWYHEFGQHYIKNAAGELQAVYPCSEAIYGKPCPICQSLNRATHAATDDETIELLKEAKAGRSFLMNVLALDSEDPDTPQILEVRNSVMTQMLEAIEEWGGALFDTDGAQVIVINRDGKGLNTKYTLQVSPKKHKVPASALAKLNDLDEYVKMESEEKRRIALSAINSVAGLLPAAADRPSTPTRALPAADSFEDVEPIARPAAKPTAALAEELDDLLGDLN